IKGLRRRRTQALGTETRIKRIINSRFQIPDLKSDRKFGMWNLESKSQIMADIQYYGTGRRKTSTARVYLRPGSGAITVNKREFNAYFPNEALQMIIRQPLRLTENSEKFDIF